MDGGAGNAAVPGVLLQPLVENAVKYGRMTSPVPLRVSIHLSVDEGFLQIEVANTGDWIEPPSDRQIGGVGLGNSQPPRL